MPVQHSFEITVVQRSAVVRLFKPLKVFIKLRLLFVVNARKILNRVGKIDGSYVHAELFAQFQLVVHNALEGFYARAHLQNAHILKVAHHGGYAQKLLHAVHKFTVAQIAVFDIRKLDAVAP